MMPSDKEEQARLAELASITPAEREERRAAYAARMRDYIANGGDAGQPLGAPGRRRGPSDPVPLGALLANLRDRATGEWADAKMALACYQAMYPDGAEPEDVEQRAADSIGAAACEEAEAWRDCERAVTGFGCPRARAAASYERVRDNLSRARVPRDDYELVLRHAAGKARLLATDPMLLVGAVRRAARRRAGESVRFTSADEKLVGGRARVNEVYLRGDERAVLMGGNKGRGKTTAAIYALGYEGGLYSTEYAFTRPKNAGGMDVAEAKRARVLVVDQFGRGHLGDSKYALSSIEEVIDARKAEKLLTILVGNFNWDDAFRARYDELVASRLMGYGVVVVFRGPDMRAQLREEPLPAA